MPWLLCIPLPLTAELTAAQHTLAQMRSLPIPVMIEMQPCASDWIKQIPKGEPRVGMEAYLGGRVSMTWQVRADHWQSAVSGSISRRPMLSRGSRLAQPKVIGLFCRSVSIWSDAIPEVLSHV